MTSFIHLLTLYMADEGRFLAERTMQTRAEHLHMLFGWIGADYGPPSEMASRVRDCTAYLLDSGLSHNTVIARRESLRLFFEWAITEGHWTEANPVRPIRTLCGQPSHRRGMTEAEMERLVNYRWPAHQSFWPTAIRVGWATGLRLADVALLSGEALLDGLDAPPEWGKTVAVLRLVPRKGRRFGVALEIPISRELSDLLSERRRHGLAIGGYFFPSMAAHYQRDAQKTLSAQFARAVRDCGLSGVSFHSLRHGVVTRLLEGGAPPAVVAAITGHSMQVMARYSHPGLEAKREALGV